MATDSEKLALVVGIIVCFLCCGALILYNSIQYKQCMEDNKNLPIQTALATCR